jgi:hypothetical protein
MRKDQIERAILENQIILAEAMWMLLQSQGGGASGILSGLSTRIMQSRKVLAEYEADEAMER